MSRERLADNPGKREREARKRHRRARLWYYDHGQGTVVGPLKLGRKHLLRRMKADLAVADNRNTGRGGGVMSLPAESPQQDHDRLD